MSDLMVLYEKVKYMSLTGQLDAVQENPELIGVLDEKVQIEAIKDEPWLIMFIDTPSQGVFDHVRSLDPTMAEPVDLEEITRRPILDQKKYMTAYRRIKSSSFITEEEIMCMVWDEPRLVQFLTHTMQTKCLAKNPWCIIYVKSVTEAMMLAAIQRDVRVSRCLSNPTSKVLREVARQALGEDIPEPMRKKSRRKVKYNKPGKWKSPRGRWVDGKRLCLDCPKDISERHGRSERCFECAALRQAENISKWKVKNPTSPEKQLEYRKRHENRTIVDKRKDIYECIICGEPIDDRHASAKYCLEHSNVMGVANSRYSAMKRREENANG